MGNRIKLDKDALASKYPTFNAKRDRGVVIHGLAVNLTKVIERNELPVDVGKVTYNELPLSEVSGRVNDKFDFLGKEIRAKGIAAAASASSGSGSVGASGRPIESVE